MNVPFAEFVSLLMLACAAAMVVARSLLVALILLSAYSALAAVLCAVFGAVDVAFTEAVVGAGISGLLWVQLFHKVEPVARPPRGGVSPWVALGAACAVGGFLLWTCLALPPFGDPASPVLRYLGPDYVERSLSETRTPNVVTAILADYRGFDTLIETAVIVSAAVCCLLIRGREPS